MSRISLLVIALQIQFMYSASCIMAQTPTGESTSEVTEGTTTRNSKIGDSAGSISSTWPSLSPRMFIEIATDTMTTELRRSPKRQNRGRMRAIAREARRRLLTTDAPSREPFEVVYRLLVWSEWNKLSDEEKKVVQQAVDGRLQKSSRDLNVEEVKFLTYVLEFTGGEITIPDLLADWLKGRDVSEMSLEDLEYLAVAFLNQAAVHNTGIRVRWTGFLQVSQDDEYQFSDSPLYYRDNLNRAEPKASLKMELNGQAVLDTGNAEFKSQAVGLKKGQLLPIKVEFEFLTVDEEMSLRNPAAAILYWQGSKTPREIIPASAYKHREGNELLQGLQGIYGYRLAESTEEDESKPEAEQRIIFKRKSPQIAYCWGSGGSFAEQPYQEILDLLVNEVAKKAADPNELAKSVAYFGSSASVRQFAHLAEQMTPDQRAGILRALKEPPLLQQLDKNYVKRIYWMLRGGAEEEAVHFVGRWLQSLPRPETEFTCNFSKENRGRWHDLNDAIFFDYPQGRDTLKSYLMYPDGNCCLNVAYVLSYAMAVRGQCDEWTETIDGRIREFQQKGVIKSDWLVARAQAEEVRSAGTTERESIGTEDSLAGWMFIEEAAAYANQEAEALSLARERISRIALSGNRTAAVNYLTYALDRCESQEARSLIERDWRDEMVSAKDEAVKLAQFRVAAVYKSLLENLPEPMADSTPAPASTAPSDATQSNDNISSATSSTE